MINLTSLNKAEGEDEDEEEAATLLSTERSLNRTGVLRFLQRNITTKLLKTSKVIL